MKLILTVTSEQRARMGSSSQHVFEERGGTIGRSEDSDWVLPDLNRIVSNRHSIIDFCDGDFFLTDTSTNGVFVNDADESVGYNNTVRLHEGDSLLMGEYEIYVEVEVNKRFSPPFFRDDSVQSMDSLESPPKIPETEKSEPVPLGLSVAGIEVSESAPPLPTGWDSEDDEFNHMASQSNHTPGVNEAFSLPQAHLEQIPEDWDKVGTGVDEAKHKEAELGVKTSATQDDISSSLRQNSGYDASPSSKSKDIPQSHSDGVSEFLRGAGIDPSKMQADGPKVSMQQLGRLYREMVQGMMDVLIARSNLKREFRVPHTIIRATENNPLKFSMGVDDALEYLLLKQGNGFLPPEAAFREAYQDVKDHQIATVVGMRVAVDALLRMFSPAQLQAKFKNSAKVGRLLSLNKSNANWELYLKWYASLSTDGDDDFQQMFATEFGRAYEAQIARLLEARAKSEP